MTRDEAEFALDRALVARGLTRADVSEVQVLDDEQGQVFVQVQIAEREWLGLIFNTLGPVDLEAVAAAFRASYRTLH